MRVGVVRTVRWASIGADAGAIEPRVNVAALPDAAARALRVVLSGVISALGEAWPVQRKTTLDQPFAEIGAAGRTARDRPPVPVEAHGRAVDWAPRNERIKVVRGLRAAAIS